MQRLPTRPPPTDFFAPSSRLPAIPSTLRPVKRRNSLLSTLSTTLKDIVSIAHLAANDEVSASTVDSQPLTSKTVDNSLKQNILPSLTSRMQGEEVRSPVRVRTAKRHIRNRSDMTPSTLPKLPQPSQVLIENFLHQIDPMDAEDLRFFETIYYLPDKRCRKAMKTQTDPKDWYQIVKGDHFAFRYEILEFLGLGAFGKVSRCIDHKTGETVAVKVFKKTKSFERQANVEMRLFDVIQMHVSARSKIVSLKDSFKFRGHTCLVYELLSLSMQECIKQNEYKGFSPGWIRRVAYQLLEALVELKTCRILHCDIKPDNIAFTQDIRTSVKVIDLGSGSFEDETIYTYIQSRFYRAPEILLGQSYSFPIDMWSLGCVVAELFLGRPLFIGEDERDQLLAIMEVIGTPPEEMVQTASRKLVHFYEDGRPKIVPSSHSKRIPGSMPLSRLIQTDDLEFLDFIESKNYSECLIWQPHLRLTPEDGLLHPYVINGLRAVKRREKSVKRISLASTDPRSGGRKNSRVPPSPTNV